MCLLQLIIFASNYNVEQWPGVLPPYSHKYFTLFTPLLPLNPTALCLYVCVRTSIHAKIGKKLQVILL